MALTQPQLLAAVADRAECTKADTKRVLDALEAVALEELSNAQKVRIGGLVQLTVRVKPAQKKRPAAIPRLARRSRSPPSRRASMSAPVRWRGRRERCRRCRRPVGDSPRETGLLAAHGKASHARATDHGAA